MTREKVYFLLLAILAVLSIAFIGVAIAERSILIALACVLGMYVSFTTARKLRERTAEKTES